MKYYVQGDVILKQVSKLPDEATLVQRDVKVLQQSEVTGHHHQFRDVGADLYQVGVPTQTDGVKTITPNLGKYIDVKVPIVLYHGRKFEEQPSRTGTGDHDAFTVEPGTYYIDIVREYDYDSQEIVRVMD